MSSRHRPGSARGRDVKRSVLRRHGARCFYCGVPFTDVAEATLDHYIPYSLWRTWWVPNLVLACADCNQGKADRLPWPLVWLLLSQDRTGWAVAA
ncbi:HNH endonuclease [Streptomyces sp. HU2014]|uniref:HNH endonuclease n=1 Tax=Streptomyces sp. HU2014 TaxID=2939414 RepID=UPI00200C96BD|nr:HNH endonuclease [Streptomyces sp. HU2014]UQI43214.1 HNH endonuclease [Streptomyces sp. HU2014]